MKMLRNAAAGLLVLVLAGCAGLNLIGVTTIYQVKTVYAGTLEAVTGWRELCWSRPYAELMRDVIARPVCQDRRARLRAIQAADNKAFAAITVAENCLSNTPLANCVPAAWSAVTSFQRAVPVVK